MAASLSGADLKVIGNNVNKLIFSIRQTRDQESGRFARQAHRRQPLRFERRRRRPSSAEHNMDPGKDVNLMRLGTMANMFGALKSGAVEASVVSPPTRFLSEKMDSKRSSTSPKWISPIRTRPWRSPVTLSAKNRI
jgi:hypothetical protein